jgi:hypothetical protein
MLSVVVLSVVGLNVIVLSVIVLSVVVLSVIVLSFVVLSVVVLSVVVLSVAMNKEEFYSIGTCTGVTLCQNRQADSERSSSIPLKRRPGNKGQFSK